MEASSCKEVDNVRAHGELGMKIVDWGGLVGGVEWLRDFVLM